MASGKSLVVGINLGGKITTTYSTSKPILKRLVRLSEDIQKIANSF